MTEARWITADALTALRAMPDASVDLVMTSPPFLALRSYLPADHPDKPLEIGSESTPGEFMDVLLDVVVELRRVLAPHGSLCVELGDTYCGAGGYGSPDSPNPDGRTGARSVWQAQIALGVAPPPADPSLSADARRTAKNNALLAIGKHPATLRPLVSDDRTCGEHLSSRSERQGPISPRPRSGSSGADR